MTYDVMGNLATSLSPNQHLTEFVYDDTYRLDNTVYPDTSTVDYDYDNFGNVTNLTDNVNSATSFFYDSGELLDYTLDPLLKETDYTFNLLGQMQSLEDRKNQTTSYLYYNNGNLHTITYPDASTTNFTYYANGSLQTMTDSVGTKTYNYDTLNRLDDFTDGQGFAVDYEYDSVGNATKITYPVANKEAVYVYDDLNRMTNVTWDNTYTASFHYDDAGRLTSVDNFNGTKTYYEYDDANRLTAVKNKKGIDPIATYEYELDAIGNRTKAREFEPVSVLPPLENTAYTYNSAKNRLLSAGSDNFVYDYEGQLTSKNDITYNFDQRHFLTSIVDGGNTTTFTYSDDGVRVKANRDGVITKYIYDADNNLLAEANDAGQIQSYYIYGANGLLAKLVPNGAIYTYHFDGSGNTIAITDQSQNIVNTYAYSPFGEILSATENIENPFKFAGQYGVMYEGDGIYYMRARYYDASIGRFISEDPIGFDGDGPNLYAYVLNNPINFVDPDGQEIVYSGNILQKITTWWNVLRLRVHSKTASKLIRDLKNDSQTVNIKIGSSDNFYNWNTNEATFNPSKKYIYDGSKKWHYRPPEVGLIHELIHAYHDLNGGRDPIYEEDKTLGLGCKSGEKYTENKIRRDYGIDQRPHY